MFLRNDPLLFCIMLMLTGCSTANNFHLPPYESKRVEMTCNRRTQMPPGFICDCNHFGNGDRDINWECKPVTAR